MSTTKLAQHWAELLPELGAPLVRDINGIIALKERAANEYTAEMKKAEKREEELEAKIESAYTPAEIREAKKAFYCDHADMKLEPEPSSIFENKQEIHKLPDGRQIHISDADAGFFRALRKLPVATRLSILHIGARDCRELYTSGYNELRSKVVAHFGKKWHDRDSGEKVLFNEYDMEYLCSMSISKRELLGKIKRSAVPIEMLEQIDERFTGIKSPYYLKD